MNSLKSLSLGQKLVTYGVGAGAVSLASAAQADIIYSGPLEISGNTIFFDLQNTVAPSTSVLDPGHDFELTSKPSASKAKVFGVGSTQGASFSEMRPPATGEFYVNQFGPGATIGSAGSFNMTTAYFYDGTPSAMSDWSPGERGFIGLRFNPDGMTPLYGWADVKLNNVNGDTPGVFTLYGYAFDDAGIPITTGAIPEPSSIALLVAGAAGVVALRRRKK